ncbi:hypothetical protein E2542_SST25343 [Spatholobus suberectus]|nr:hypothetical protein E2542_SST25343 [Spatholobus suberectus]
MQQSPSPPKSLATQTAISPHQYIKIEANSFILESVNKSIVTEQDQNTQIGATLCLILAIDGALKCPPHSPHSPSSRFPTISLLGLFSGQVKRPRRIELSVKPLTHGWSHQPLQLPKKWRWARNHFLTPLIEVHAQNQVRGEPSFLCQDPRRIKIPKSDLS